MPFNTQVAEKGLDSPTPGVVVGLVVRNPNSAALTTTIEGGWIRLKVSPTDNSVLGYPFKEWRIVDTSKAFTASKDTYVYVSSAGALGYLEVANGAAKPTAATLETTGGYGAQFIAKVVTDGTRILAAASAIVDMADRRAAADLMSDTVYFSFNATEVGDQYWTPNVKCRIWKYQGVVVDTLANTDVGTITASTGVNDVYTAQTNGVVTFALSSATGTRASALPSAYFTVAAGQTVKLTSAKATAGGSADLQIIYSRE